MSLTQKQLESISYLNSGYSQSDTAAKIGVTARTLQRWAKIPEYQQAMGKLSSVAVSPQATTSFLNNATQAITTYWENRDKARQKEADLLDDLQEKLEQVLASDPCNFRAMDRLIKISERRSKLFGIEIKNMSVLEASEVLLSEGVIKPNYACIIADGIQAIEDNLKDAD